MASASKRKSCASAVATGGSSRRSSSKRTITPANESPSRNRVKTEPTERPTEPRSTQIRYPQSTDSRPKKAVTSTVYDDIVFVKVGHSATKFGIHRGLLTKSSEWFKRVLDPVYKIEEEDVFISSDGSSTVVILATDDDTVFARVSTWLYSNQFFTTNDSYTTVSWRHVIDVYIFAVKKQIHRLQNSCVNAVILKQKRGSLFAGQDNINHLWKNEGPGLTPLRRLFVDMFVASCGLKTAIHGNTGFHPSFLRGLIIKFYELKRDGTTKEKLEFWRKKKDYYVHGSDNPIPLD